MKTYLLPPVNDKELATILAALRIYEVKPEWTDHFGGVCTSAPTSKFVDALCIKLNTEGVVCGP